MMEPMSRRVGRRALAVSSLAAGIAAGLLAVVQGLGSSPASLSAAHAAAAATDERSVAFGATRVTLQTTPAGRTCISFDGSRACALRLAPTQIVYAASATAVGGAAGGEVRAVILKLTRKGTVWAQIHDGAFYAPLPAAHRLRAVVKVLRDGTRRTFGVTATR
jgi:hypothetical protein